MGQRDFQKTGAVLIAEGVHVHEELLQLISDSGLKGTAIAALLENARHVSRADLAAFLAGDFETPLIGDLRKFDLYEDAVKVVPEELARRFEFVPIAKMGELLCIARADYHRLDGLAEIRAHTGLRLKVFQAQRNQLLAVMDLMYGSGVLEIPPPSSTRHLDTSAIRSTPPEVVEDSEDVLPLIQMPAEEEPELQEAPSIGGSGGEPPIAEEDVHEILDPIRIGLQEFEDAEKGGGARYVREFEETFLKDQPLKPIKLS